VPLGTLLGQEAGWRAPFAAIGACAVLAALAIAVAVPRVRVAAGPPLREQLAVLGRRPVLLALGAIVLFWGASFTAYTYLAPLLSQRAGLGEGAITLVLLLVGVTAVTGNVLGGRAADRDLRLTLLITAAVTAGALLILGPASGVAAAAIAVVATWQLAAWCFPPAIQVQVYRAGGAAADLAVSLSVSAFNVGIVLGAGLGGIALGAGGLTAVTTTAAAIGLIALATVAVLVRRPRPAPAPPVTGHPQCPPVPGSALPSGT
jgi:DHA1 family inner membrane transport protein